ncbi:MAG TPA: hypothetical protein VGS22_07340 [Thermoanaerobaculia bacterium]|jgi:predicted nucleic acid-binding protein|nr:hypothetical protein [Thermoanaerobaculia bacterium]
MFLLDTNVVSELRKVRPGKADTNVAAWAETIARLHVPNPRPFRDGLIAATALVHDMTVVTRNVGDFEATGVPLLNPWEWRPD